MAVNLERFKNDLKALIELGQNLEFSMMLEVFGKDKFRNVPEDTAKELMKTFPDFRSRYEERYSEAVTIMRQLLPDRLENFRSLYEKPKGRRHMDNENYAIQDFKQARIPRMS